MQCSRCGSELPSQTLFCETCGAAQARTRTRTTDGTSGAEGAPLMGEPVRLSAPTPDGHRPTVERTSVLAVLSLIIGILSVATMTCLGFWFLVLGPFVGVPPALAGVVTGHVAIARIQRSSGGLTGTGAAIVGLVLNYLTLFVSLGVTAVWLLLGELVLG